MSKTTLLRNAIIAIFVALIASCAIAQTIDCDAVIVDGAHLFKGEHAMTNALDALVNAGADVRVRTYSSLGDFGTLDALEITVEQGCKSWLAPNGNRKNNLIAFINVDGPSIHKIGVYPGSLWKTSVGAQWTRIENLMKPDLRTKQFDAAFITGISEATRVIKASVNGTTTAPPTIIIPPPPAPETPTDYSFLFVLLGVVVLAGLTWLVITLRAHNKRDNENRLAARQRARIAQEQAASLLVEIDGDFAFFASTCQEKDRIEKVKTILASTSESFSRLEKIGAGNDNNSYGAAQYIAIAEPYEDIVDNLRRAKQLMSNDFFGRKGNSDTTPTAEMPESTPKPTPVVPYVEHRHPNPLRDSDIASYRPLQNRHQSTYVDNSTTIIAPVINYDEPRRSEYVPSADYTRRSNDDTPSSGGSNDYSRPTPESSRESEPEISSGGSSDYTADSTPDCSSSSDSSSGGSSDY